MLRCPTSQRRPAEKTARVFDATLVDILVPIVPELDDRHQDLPRVMQDIAALSHPWVAVGTRPPATREAPVGAVLSTSSPTAPGFVPAVADTRDRDQRWPKPCAVPGRVGLLGLIGTHPG